MNLQQWLDHLEKLHPADIELGLERVKKVYDRLNPDFTNKRVVVVGGTNGKGSTLAILASILRNAGFRVGIYTSPHILDYNERVRIENRNATDQELCEGFAAVERARQEIPLTYFEFGTLAALAIFADAELDFVLLEVGLGGRLDAVNIADAEISVITNVALDHTDWLGPTREHIGFEKAGIYRKSRPALFGDKDIPDSVNQQVERVGARLILRGVDFDIEIQDQDSWQWQGKDKAGQARVIAGLPRYDFPLSHSLDNAALAIQAALLLDPGIAARQVLTGLLQATLPGRFQRLGVKGRQVILDVGHNEHAIANLVRNLQQHYPDKKVLAVVGMLSDKDIRAVLSRLASLGAEFFLGSIHENRGADSKILYNLLGELGVNNRQCFDDVKEAFNSALESATDEDIILVTGSFFTVCQVFEQISEAK